MKSSEILRRAAKLVEDRRFNCGCDAINYLDSTGVPLYRFKIVAPEPKPFVFDPWWGSFKDDSYLLPSSRNARIIGLCLAAAIAESEGD